MADCPGCGRAICRMPRFDCGRNRTVGFSGIRRRTCGVGQYAGARRGARFFCRALAKIGRPEAGEIARRMLQDNKHTAEAIDLFGRLNDRKHVEILRPFLKSKHYLAAEQALRRLGEKLPKFPTPHLVSGSARPDFGSAEWGTNHSIDTLRKDLRELSEVAQKGFGTDEVNEVFHVAERMILNATKTFRFAIEYGGKQSQLWIQLFLDDLDSPDLTVWAPEPLINEWRSRVERV